MARRGAMRGIPLGEGAWLEVSTPGEMWEAVRELQNDSELCSRQMAAAKAYYMEHLNSEKIHKEISSAFLHLSKKSSLQ